jgi:tyrosyl-tRNA synthetase
MERVQLLLSPETHPREAKAALAEAIVSRYHSPEAAQEARREFDLVFREHETPSQMPELAVPAEAVRNGRIWVVKLVALTGCAASHSEARRLVQQGGVRLGRDARSLQVVADPEAEVQAADGAILKIGKKNFFRLALK